MTRIYAFGAFDGLHLGHRSYLRQAQAQGTHLTVIVGRDTTIERRKGRAPRFSESERIKAVADLGIADEVRLGGIGPPLAILEEEIDVVVLGYDQAPGPAVIEGELRRLGKEHVRVVRARPFLPFFLKSSILKRLGFLRR